MLLGRSDVPLDRDPSARFLPWLIAFMVYLAVLAMAAAVAVNNLAERWDTGLSDELTVQVPPPVGEGRGDGLAVRVDAVLAALRGQPGVRALRVIDDARMQRLLEPWLGNGVTGQDLPLPRLISVEIDPASPPDLAALRAAVADAVPDAVVDDHQRALDGVLDAVRSFQVLALLVLGLVTGAAVITIVFVTRTGLAVHRRVIELLHLIGAHDAYVAGQFQRHALRLGLLGGTIGLVLGALTLAGLSQALAARDSAAIPELSLRLWQLGMLILIPPVTAVVAMLTARLTVLRTLARLS